MDPMISIGQPAPDFILPDLDGKTHRLHDLRGGIVVINFWSAECPHAARADTELVGYLRTWGQALRLLPIASNANEKPDQIRQVATERGLPLVLYDSQQKVADLFAAVTTPHLFVIDAKGRVRYQGAFDNVTFRQRQPTRFYLKAAIEAVLAGREPDPAQSPPYGCAIVRFAL